MTKSTGNTDHRQSVRVNRKEWLAFIAKVKSNKTTAWAVLQPMIKNYK